MKEIKVSFVDFEICGNNFNPDDFILTKIIRKKYDVRIVDKDPDFVFCSCFHYKVLNYNCPRIFFTGECVFPDFNIYDYAIGFNNFAYQDRYLRFPLWLDYEMSVDLAKKKHLLSDDEILGKKRFCNFVVSNENGADERKLLFEALNSYKKVDSAGKYLNNMGERCGDKLEFQKNYKFSAAFENYKYDGYITEKIMDAFAAGTIPIYFGTDYITKEINPKSFINYNDFSSPQKLVDYVKKIDTNDEEYLKIMKEPVFTKDCGASKDFLSDDCSKVLNFFTNIFENNYGVIRRNTGWAGKVYEKPFRNVHLANEYLFPWNELISKKKIVIIGAGKVGQSFVKQINLQNRDSLVAWLDNNYKLINNPKIQAVENIQNFQFDYVIIAMKNKDNVVEAIKCQLKKLKVQQSKIVWQDPVTVISIN